LGWCVAGTAWGASDDDDEDWHDTKGPGGSVKRVDDDERPAKSKKSESDDDKAADNDKRTDQASDGEAKKADQRSAEDKKSDDNASNDIDSDTKRSAKAKNKHKWKSEGLASTTKLSFAALGSYGFPGPLGTGLGVRGGVHLDGLIPLYFGGVAEYFFGVQSIKSSLGDKATRTQRFMYFGAEAGVEVEATKDLQLRPFLGLGLASYKDENCSSTRACAGGSEIHMTITPGIAGLYYIDSFFFGADFRYLIVPGASTASGAIVSATLGVRF
jgi:hypothetical protein